MKIEIIDYGAVMKNQLPKRAKPMDAGADVFAPETYDLDPGDTLKIPLGFGVNIPNGFTGFIFPRSSLAAQGIICQLPPIDATYIGEIHAVVTNTGNSLYVVEEGAKIGQLVILPCIIPDFIVGYIEERGANGFGSTGK